MRINLEEAFKSLKEDNNESAPNNESEENELKTESQLLKTRATELNTKFAKLEKAKKDKDLGKNIRKINDKMIEDLWDQVYCSLTDSSDERVRNLLGDWSGHRHYAVTHVSPSTTASKLLPKGFKSKAGYNDIIVFSPELDIQSPLLDDENPSEEDLKAIEKRNKKNRKQDFSYAKEVAEIYHLPYQELEDAFVLYVPKSKYLNADTIDLNKAMTLFPEELIDVYLNNTNQRTRINGKSRFLYDLKPYFNQKLYSKDKKIDFIKNNRDMLNWVNDTADEIFHDTFGVKQEDADYTQKEEAIFNLLLAKTLDRAAVVADNAIKGYRDTRNLPELLAQLDAEEKNLIPDIEAFNTKIDDELAKETDPKEKEKLQSYKIEYVKHNINDMA